MTKKSMNIIVNGFIVLVMIVAVAPLIFYGKDSIFTIHDSLDGVVAWVKMLKDQGLLFALDSPTNSLGNMSSAYFIMSFNISTLAFLIFDIFTAHVVLYILKILVGYCSMLLLLRYLFPSEANANIIKLVSLSFALLPAGPQMWFLYDSVPLLCYAFLNANRMDSKKIDKRIFLLLLFPVISNFAMAGFFLMVIWTIATVALWIYKKKLNINLCIGLCCLMVGYILVDLKMFYVKLVLREPLNRGIIHDASTLSINQMLKLVPHEYINGGYHAPHLAQKVIFPTIFLVLGLTIIFLLYKLSIEKYKKDYKSLAHYSLLSIALVSVSVAFSIIDTAYNKGVMTELINNVLVFLRGFNWGRFSFLNRAVFYICFALVLVTLLNFTQLKKIRFISYVIACLQIAVVLTYSEMYSYSCFNLNHANEMQKDNMLTYNEFYAEDFFNSIKDDLNYNGEGVAALGYHPSVLMYNGFSCVDGYNSTYPLSRMLAFRKVIEPQLEINQKQKKYYDSWGGRMYLYNDDINSAPTRTKVQSPVELHINTEAFRELGGVYILSRVEIGNAPNMGLDFIKKYTSDASIYDIYVYKAA